MHVSINKKQIKILLLVQNLTQIINVVGKVVVIIWMAGVSHLQDGQAF